MALWAAWLAPHPGRPDAGLGAAGPVAGQPASDTLVLGRKVYNYRCYFCHGYSGDARTLAARFLEPAPRKFTEADPRLSDREAMIRAVSHGRPGTAMQPFLGVLSAQEIGAVVDYVRSAFMVHGHPNTRYHTEQNGWPDHERFRPAFPFATGEIPLDAPPETLTASQRAGLRLYQRSCLSCHDRSRVSDAALRWEAQAVSYPRPDFNPGDSLLSPDAWSGATSFADHDVPPVLDGLTAQERDGEALYQANCAFCHAADGTGRNWIGSFLDPSPRDLTDPAFMGHMSTEGLARVIRRGVPGTSMPAWGAVLDKRQIAAVVAYVGRAFHPLSGDEE
jgi:cytochrome c oxidase cbb3-type subunit 3